MRLKHSHSAVVSEFECINSLRFIAFFINFLASLRSLLYRGIECSCFLLGRFILITMKSNLFHACLVNIF